MNMYNEALAMKDTLTGRTAATSTRTRSWVWNFRRLRPMWRKN